MSKTRIIASFLSCLLIFSLISASAFAEESVTEVSADIPVLADEVSENVEETVSPSPAASAPTIIKNPEPEAVPEGESCIFVAKASNYEWISWYFVKGEREIIYIQDAEKKFPGLEVKGYLSTVLTLNSVPAELDGWRVGALFGNSSGQAGTTTCTITVTAKPKPTAEPAPVYQTPAPTLTPAIVSASPVPSIPVQTVPTTEPVLPQTLSEPVENDSSSLTFIIVLAVIILVIAFAAGLLVTLCILNRKGIIDLEKLFRRHRRSRH